MIPDYEITLWYMIRAVIKEADSFFGLKLYGRIEDNTGAVTLKWLSESGQYISRNIDIRWLYDSLPARSVDYILEEMKPYIREMAELRDKTDRLLKEARNMRFYDHS